MRPWRLSAVVLGSALTLSACGASQSPSAALAQWVSQSAFHSAVATLRADARHAHLALVTPSTSPGVLRTVCELLHIDAASAQGSLPSPDAQATVLLGRAYGQLGNAASLCYEAGDSPSRRQRADQALQRAAATLAEGSARVGAAVG